jgi:hypothetical protein
MFRFSAAGTRSGTPESPRNWISLYFLTGLRTLTARALDLLARAAAIPLYI